VGPEEKTGASLDLVMVKLATAFEVSTPSETV
jgi:hypothetical protein